MNGAKIVSGGRPDRISIKCCQVCTIAIVPIRIILVDDHDLVRAGIRALLERLPHVTVVGEARNGQEALTLLTEAHPDIAFVGYLHAGF